MGRPRELEEAKMVPVILDKETREIVDNKKGDRGVSRFIRESIMLRAPRDTSSSDQTELKKLKEENITLTHEIERYKRRDQVITKEREKAVAYIARDFEAWKDTSKAAHDPAVRQGWLSSRCKACDVKPTDILGYVADHSDIGGDTNHEVLRKC